MVINNDAARKQKISLFYTILLYLTIHLSIFQKMEPINSQSHVIEGGIKQEVYVVNDSSDDEAKLADFKPHQSSINIKTEQRGLNSDEVAATELPDDLVEVRSMPYRHLRLRIYQQKGMTPPRYFYEPFLLFDPQKTVSQCDKATGQAYVRITIRMWDAEMEAQVVNWLRRLPGSEDVKDYSVQIMPYKEVRLVTSVGTAAYSLSEKRTAYHHCAEDLQFYLFCNAKAAADSVAESFKTDPGFAMKNLALECISARTVSASRAQRKRVRLEDGAASYLRFNIDTNDPAEGKNFTCWN